ncbi:hypothetical protein MJO28_009837 [Puccinia striiformis f. sp. tritici]|uniref:Uncharacterized protein n=1 Tax=Puccinia striiformis f. sp. tritici TaxID=168172 RepID=A0ACC0EA89_9BASI|nr:hypothetical protein Pst134EA_017331 [Puccinia striiformis f. sp. tritici]KAH9461022.1 hypothetical protein Pst134EA_017331 [Puccinia striiformis f. sp. tritici]KAI7947929.1 hypothetical protein MJO28_009837 [Puccinia striiformis f. sp. tritici]
MLHHLRPFVLTRWIGLLLMAQVIAGADIVLPSSGSLKVPAGQKMVIRTLGSGNQLYKCDQASLKWTSAGAIADLFDVTTAPNPEGLPEELMKGGRSTTPRLNLKDFTQVGNHFFSTEAKPVPIFKVKNDEMRTTKIGSEPSPGKPDRNVVWLELKVITGTLAKTIFRTSTRGGQLTGACTQNDVGKPRQVKYAALYTFFA